MGRRGSGVEVRPGSIRLSFVYNGKWCRETLRLHDRPMPPTPANIKYATRLAAEIRRQLAAGAFDYAEYFPSSPRVPNPGIRTLGEAFDKWLDSMGYLEAATRDQYRNAIGVWLNLLDGKTDILKLNYQLLASKIGGHPWKSAKTLNNYLIVLRGVFNFLYHGERAAANPMIGIKNWKVVKKLPDPLSVAERDQILDDIAEHYDVRVTAYFQFAFFTGMRPEEIIALRWGDIDWGAGIARVQRVRTFRGSEREGSKTHTERDADLTDPALAAIEAMRPYTFLKGADADIFENPVTGKPWHDERSQREHYWQPAFKRLGIRWRRPYSTRHTFATVALMGGVNAAYIASQLGHSVKLLLDRYARWLPGADGGFARDKMRGVMNSSPNIPRQWVVNDTPEGKSNRRDWTRTDKRGKSRGK